MKNIKNNASKQKALTKKISTAKEPRWKVLSGIKVRKAITKLIASDGYKRDFTNHDEYHES